MSYSTTLVVEGSTSSQQPIPIATPLASSSSTTTYRPIMSGARKGQSLNLKVIKANLEYRPNGKPEFSHTGQTFIDLCESTANVHYITNVIQRKWGEDYVLVTADGLRIDDSSGTQGTISVIFYYNINYTQVYPFYCSVCITLFRAQLIFPSGFKFGSGKI